MALLNGRQLYQLYTIDWCKERGYDWLEFKKEVLDTDYSGECYASFREFLDWEYEDEEYMQYLYDHKDELLRYADWELVESRKTNGKRRKVNESAGLEWFDWVFDEPYMNETNIDYALKTLDTMERLYRNSKGNSVLNSLGDLYFEVLEKIDDARFEIKELKKEVQKRNK